MRHPLRPLLALLCLALAPLSTTLCAAQTLAPQQPDRVPAHPEQAVSVRLAGHVPRWAAPAADTGPAASDTPLHLTFILARAPQQQAAFTQLLADQQDPTSPRYHQWLTPQQIGDQFGPTQHDIDALTAWVAAQGLTNPEVSPSRLFLSVTAPVATVSAALATPFHSFLLNGEPHIAATQDPALPAAFAPLVDTIAGLADTPNDPTVHAEAVDAEAVPTASATPATAAHPHYTAPSGSHYITPGDFANIFNFPSFYSGGLTGVGQRIAIIGRSRVLSTDITYFEAETNLSANLPNVVLVNPLYDPGITGTGDQTEATIDVDRALGTATSAQVDLVLLPTSGGGIFGAAQYAVNTLNDPVMNLSFGSCEVNAGLSGVKQWDTLFSQAAAQGISVFVSSSDSGAATCDTQFGVPPATQVLSINYICASSYATCVGGTEFNDTANPSLYWNITNTGSLVSANGYIPQGAWNEPTSVSNGVTSYVAAATGGGASLYIPKPSWQTGTGVPADGARDVPDVSFPAAAHDGYFACYAAGGGDCSTGRFEYFFGTSAAAPTMAAIAAILDQRTGTRQGNLNPILYRLAATPSNSVFNDVTVASSGVASCSVTVPSMCNNSTPSPSALTGGLAGYAVTTGYDQATGWGSINGANFLAALGSTQAASTIALTQTPSPAYVGNSVVFTATVTHTAAGTPTGWVQFFLNGATLGNAIALPASGIVATPSTLYTTTFTGTISATYSGDASFAAAQTGLIKFSVVPPGFSSVASPAALVLSAGATNSATVTYSSFGGFAGTITQTCGVYFNGTGTPSFLPTCSYSAPSVTLAAGGTATGTITIGSTAPHLVSGTTSARLANPTAGDLLPAIAAALILPWLPRLRRRRSRIPTLLAAILAITATLTLLSGCGGSNSSANNTPTPTGSTPGSYTVYLTSFSNGAIATPQASIALTIQ